MHFLGQQGGLPVSEVPVAEGVELDTSDYPGTGQAHRGVAQGGRLPEQFGAEGAVVQTEDAPAQSGDEFEGKARVFQMHDFVGALLQFPGCPQMPRVGVGGAVQILQESFAQGGRSARGRHERQSPRVVGAGQGSPRGGGKGKFH